MPIGHQVDIAPTMHRDNLPKRPFLSCLLDDIWRKILLRSDGVDPDAARESAGTGNPVSYCFYEVEIQRGWSLCCR